MIDCLIDVPFDDAQLPLARHRSNVDRFLGPVSLTQPLRFFDNFGNKQFGDAFMNVTALYRRTCLATIRERAPDGAARCVLNVRIVEHNHRIFAAEFEHHRDQIFRGCFCHALARRDAAGEHDLVRARCH